MAHNPFATIRKVLAAPVFPEDEEKTRVARLLNPIILSVLLIAILTAATAPFVSPRPAVSFGIAVALVLFVLLAWFLMRGGAVRAAAAVYAVLGVALAAAAVVFAGGVTGAMSMTLILVTIIAGLLMGRGGIFAVGFTCGVVGLVTAYLENAGHLPPAVLPLSPLAAWVVLIACLLAAGVVQSLATQSINDALARARRNERELTAINQEIERARASLEQRNERLQAVVAEYIDYLSGVARGDLVTRLALAGKGLDAEDPLTVLGTRLNETVASLQAIAAQVRDTAGGLGSASSEILVSTTQQAAGASEQSAAISQASATIDQVRTIAEQTALRARAVADIAQRTREASRGGEQAVVETLLGMEQVKQEVEAIASQVLALSEQAQAIGAIIATVNEIADQSNMLALNAAVEAARAGEAGKGFAVVANEVRNLAEQSRAATVRVREILSQIQQGVNAAVMATEEGMKGVDRGMKLAGEAGLTIQQLAESITESAQAAAEIADASGQQLIGMQQIALAMQDIGQVAAQTVGSTRQSERAAEELNRLAGELREVVERYRL